MNIFNQPSYDQMQELIEIQRVLTDKSIQDFTNSPGSKTLLRGDTNNGFYGFVQPSQMGLFENNKEYSGANLALEIGLSSGTAFNSDVPLIKFSRNGKVLFIPLTGYRYSTPWDRIYNVGAVYGTNDDGFLPPMGRSGTQLSIIDSNTIQTTNDDFLGDKTSGMDYADTIGAIGDTLILKGWGEEDNNKEVVITGITNSQIIVAETLIPEDGGKKSRLYNNKNIVKQDCRVTIGDKQYKVRLIKGAGDNPIDSYVDPDRGAIGATNEWNDLILPLHEHAKLSNWNYPQYAKKADGSEIDDWGVGLTDENLRTHHTYGAGSYTWCQETRDDSTYRRVARGGYGASRSSSHDSWPVGSGYCWRPVLESI